MLADQQRARRRCIAASSSAAADMPDAAALERRRRAAVEDAIEIDAGPAPSAARRNCPAPRSTASTVTACGLHMLVERAADGVGRGSRAAGRDAPPGPARGRRHRCGRRHARRLRAPQKRCTASSTICCTGAPLCLALPADEAGAVIFERQLVAGHGRSGAGRQGEAAQEGAAVSSAARPARCSAQRAQRARAAGDGERVDRARCRAPPGTPGDELGRQHLDALAAMLEPDAGRRVERAHLRARARPPAGASRAGPRRGRSFLA